MNAALPAGAIPFDRVGPLISVLSILVGAVYPLFVIRYFRSTKVVNAFAGIFEGSQGFEVEMAATKDQPGDELEAK